MLSIILYQPEIPPNTGNIIRLCANAGANLHLIHPLGFELNEKSLRRAGLDYAEQVKINEYMDLRECLSLFNKNKVFAFSTKGKTDLYDVNFSPDDALLFGPETRGLPQDYLNSMDDRQVVRIPMTSRSRSINLSNSVAIGLYEAIRQNRGVS
jgi:tRNA (cytidine/uridine-2'-O-)-methyltransferase